VGEGSAINRTANQRIIDSETHSSFVQHEPCPNCKSKDNLARYSDGHGFCFGCNHYEHADGEPIKKESRMASDLINEKEFIHLEKRSIKETTCRKFGYSVGNYKGNPVHVMSYHNDEGHEVAQKLRFQNKDFRIIGQSKNLNLFGQHLWKEGGKRIVVTEGEIDCLSISQLQDNKWPVVSIPNGAAGAARSVAYHSKWLESFENVVFCFDMDTPGKKAAVECANVLSPGKASIVQSLPEKDANECLMMNKGKELINCIWNAKIWTPDGVIPGEELWDVIIEDKDVASINYPWAGFNRMLYGMRSGELITLTSGTGIGKSSVCRELCYSLIMDGHKVGYIALEESVKRTAEGIMGIHLNIPPPEWKNRGVTEEMKREAFDASVGSGRMVLYDHWGSTSSDNLINQVRYMAKSMECQVIFLDHLSIVVSGIAEGDERRLIDNTMTRLRSLVEETNCAMILVSHLKRPEGRGHEEGARTSLSQLRGSSAIAQLSDAVLGFERDQQCTEKGNTLNVRVLKNRYAGTTGIATALEYDSITGRLHEVIKGLDDMDDVPSEFV